MKRLTLAACALIACASSSVAGPLPEGALDGDKLAWFYNRPGVTVGEAAADMDACTMFGRGMIPASSAAAGYGLIGVLVASAMDAAMSAGQVRAYADDCMIGRGYRRFMTTDATIETFQKRFAAMDEKAKSALVSTQTPPEGKLARQWANSMWLASQADASAPHHDHLIYAGVVKEKTWPHFVKPAKADTPMALLPSEAIVVLTIRTDGAPGQPAVAFSRDDPDSGYPSQTLVGAKQKKRWAIFGAATDKAPKASTPDAPAPAPAPKTLTFVVPAGLYGLASANFPKPVQFCLGTVSFEAAAGEVLDLGEFTFHPGPLEAGPLSPPAPFSVRIDASDIEARRAILAQTPQYAAALKPASYKNGHARACQQAAAAGYDAPVYGLEIPLAPWKEKKQPVGPAPALVAEAASAPTVAAPTVVAPVVSAPVATAPTTATPPAAATATVASAPAVTTPFVAPAPTTAATPAAIPAPSTPSEAPKT